ncbi:MAG: hypothetical protein IJO64_06775 [Clostridia bacterium]|nr:hypothetical protein [Clostridia bacterium]
MDLGNKNKSARRSSRKSTALLVSLILILCISVGGTVAFLIDTDGTLKNIFNPTQVETEVLKNGENTTVKNIGSTSAWIRAAVVVTWQDENGNVYSQAPILGSDYTIAYDAGWLIGDDCFCYWSSPVAENAVTGNITVSLTNNAQAPAGYFLCAEIVGSGIQSKPARVFNENWVTGGLTVDDSDADPMNWFLKEAQG